MKKSNKSILQACLFQGWHYFLLGLIIPVLVLFQLERGLSLIQIGFNMALYGGIVIVLEIPSGILADIMGQKKVYIFSVILKITTTLLSVISFIMQARGMTGSLLWGFISQNYGIGITWKIGSAILILSSLPYLWVHKKNKHIINKSQLTEPE